MGDGLRLLLRFRQFVGLCEVGVGFSLVAFHAVRSSPVAVGVRVVRLQADSFCIVLDCRVGLAFLAVRDPPVVVGNRVIRLQPDGF